MAENISFDKEALENISKELAYESAEYIADDIEQTLLNHKNMTTKLYNQYYNQLEPLSSQMTDAFIRAKQWASYTENQEQVEEMTPQAVLYAIYRDEKLYNEEIAAIQTYLNSLRIWSINGYKEITSFRELVTQGQKLVYDIEKGESQSYRVESTDIYLENVLPELRVRGQWDNIVNGESSINSAFNLVVGDISRSQHVNQLQKAFIGRSQDALYKYLYNNYSSVQKKSEGLQTARLYELYDQIRYTFFSEAGHTETITEEMLSSKQKKVDNFIAEYILAGLHKDTVPFYQMGDAVENNMVLIENKRVGASISIRTIKNAITKLYENLYKVTGEGAKKIKDRVKTFLQDFYIKVDNNKIGKQIQDGAGKAAARGIKNFVNSLSNDTLKIVFRDET